MFKLKRGKKKDKFDEVMVKAVFSTVREALESILKMEYKTVKGADGKEKTDYEMTARMMKAQARIALDLTSNIEKKSEV